MKVDLEALEETAKLLYIRALKVLPDDIKDGFEKLDAAETDATGKSILATMIKNIDVAEDTDNLLCQDTGIPIYNVTIGRGVEVDGIDLKTAIGKGCARATTEYPLRSSIVHPMTRENEHTSCGHRVPVINVDFSENEEELVIEMIPKGSGSENGSFLKMCIPAEGLDGMAFLTKIRQDEDTPDPFVPVVVCAANTEYRHVCIARDKGMTEFLAKPVSARTIYFRICALVENRRPFIRITNFFGPDRRRHLDEEYAGANRRKRSI